MKTNFDKIRPHIAKVFMVAATILPSTLGLIGCADYAAVGYSATYYEPDYHPLYGYYVYDGAPWWGPDVTYVRNNIIVRGGDHHHGWYGGHHFPHEWHHRGAVASASIHRHRR
jgi:hypothetical protein